MQVLSDLLKMLEDFVKRAILPSTTFIAVFIVGCIFLLPPDAIVKHTWYPYLKSFLLSWNEWNYIIVLVLFIGLSTIMSFLTQLVFDVWLRYKFSCIFTDSETLSELRKKVVVKIENEYKELKLTDYNDWALYQIIRKSVKGSKRYVDNTKLYGIVSISIIINIIMYSVYSESWLIALLIIPVWLISFFIIRATYRSRAYRYYLSYLTNDIPLASNTPEQVSNIWAKNSFYFQNSQ